MSEPETPAHRAGYVAVIGRPNVGKSTLVNALIGAPLAPTSPVPQTTRRRLLGILTQDHAQIVFVDTPGLHQPVQRLGEMMVEAADRALVDADVVVAVFDCTREPGAEDDLVLARARHTEAPRLLLVNKIDAVTDGRDFRTAFAALADDEPLMYSSAISFDGLPELLAAVLERLPEGPAYFPEEQLSDVMERDVAADLIRQAALGLLREELPHALAVSVEEWKQRPNGLVYVSAMVYIERESQKGMVIGRGGRMLKSIGTRAREVLEAWLDQRVYLDLQVKVWKDWRRDEQALRRLGFRAD